MESYDFFQKLYKGVVKQQNQGVFMTNLFTAAGSSHFSNSNYQTTAGTESQRSLFKKGKHLTSEMKKSFPIPFDLKSLSEFLLNQFDENKLPELMMAFDIPSNSIINSDFLSMAIASQFESFIVTDSNIVDNIVFNKYQLLLSTPDNEEEPSTSRQPLYDGDAINLLNQNQSKYKSNTNKKIIHEWVIQNIGSREWIDRKLILINTTKVRVKASLNTIEIPNLKPNEIIKLTVQFDTRSFEGEFRTIWKMVDKGNNDCFPNQQWLLDVTIDVTFIPEEKDDK